MAGGREIEPETWQGDMVYRFVVFSISIELLAAVVSCTSINVGNDDHVISSISAARPPETKTKR
jgi:hypothetical protein